VGRLQSDDFVKRLYRTLLDEQFRIKGRQKWYAFLAEMKKDLDAYLQSYNVKRPYRGRGMKDRAPLQVFLGTPKGDKEQKKETKEAV